MSNLITIPQEDGFKTSLSQEYAGGLGNMFLQASPSFTMPVGETCYAVIQANGANPFLVEFDSIDTGNNTINITDVTLFKGAGIANPTGITYPTNTEVLISDNFQFWSDIKDAINSKLDNDGGNSTTTWDLQVSGSAFRIRKDGNDMKFTDDNNAELTLSTLAAAAGTDTKVAISTDDTTPSQLEDKLTAGDGLSLTKINPLGNESLDMDIDLITTNGLKFTTNQLDIEPASNTQIGTQRISTDAEATAGVLENVSVNPKQLSDSTFNIFSFGSNGISINDGLTRFLGVTGQSTPSVSEQTYQLIVGRAATIKNLSAKAITNSLTGGGGGDTTIVVRKNGVDTALTVIITSLSTALFQDTSNSFTIVAGDLLTIRVTTTGNSGSGLFVGSLEIV